MLSSECTISLYFDSNTIPMHIHSRWTGAFPWCDALTKHDFPKTVVCDGVMSLCLYSNFTQLIPFEHLERRSSYEIIMGQKKCTQEDYQIKNDIIWTEMKCVCFIVSGLWTQNTPQKKVILFYLFYNYVISLISNNETLKRQNVLVPMKRFMWKWTELINK